ncbi:nicotinamide mononucleotide transporter [Sphingomonas sp. Leaf357]|uniref:nicotinamide riboside transporter PnuC n=1 Tax=Sphingomonas sp. Leaf357 TaxID=1736350 RepID=UPI000700640C|nr:nicotinamide riboside transporter PnuC [Sphingomonas sp. Leaf357]KQS04366.1 nicotinamide mononucleotide transporter [Sphingomonas sp. Leaf357]
MSLVEILASLLIVVNVVLVARRSVWNYAFAIAGVAIYGWIFFEAKLYSDMLLQGFFLIVNLYGWRHWARGIAEAGEVRVGRLTVAARMLWLAAILVATFVWGGLMHRFTDASYPFVDAGVAMASVAAQILLSRQKLENWILWIAVDAVAVCLYVAKDLWPTAILYILLLAISVWGLIDWRKSERI